MLRAAPGRLRLHFPGWDGREPEALEQRLSDLEGVRRASARAATGNALVEFDPQRTDQDRLLAALGSTRPAKHADAQKPQAASNGRTRPHRGAARAAAGHITGVLREGAGKFGRARIAVRGIDRDPQLARRVVRTLERRPDVRRAVVSATTGRVLVEFSDRVTSLQDIVAELSKLELPELPGEDRPAHPLDPKPLVESGGRLAGAAAGLAVVTAQRAMRSELAVPGRQIAATFAGVLGLLDSAPPIRSGLERTLGHDRAQLVFSGAAIASLTLSGSTLGLLVTGAGALRLLTEARARRDAFRDYEQRLSEAAEAVPGAIVRLEAGTRVPLDARVVEGAGTAIGSDGLPDSARPGSELEAGSRVLCGPLTVELVGDRAWTPAPRPCPPRPDAVQRYLTTLGPVAAGYAILHALRIRSPAALFTGLLLVNPRPALIGAESADTGASARVLRAGVTVVGTRPDRQIRRPDVLVVDAPRVLTTGLEQVRVLPGPSHDRGELTEIVAAMVGASGAPWGPGLPAARRYDARDAEFDGIGISAAVAGRRLRLEPPRECDESAEAVQRAIDAGEQPLVLHEEGREPAIGYLHLRPRLAPGVEQLRRTCTRHGVELLLLEEGDDRRACRGVARRADIELVVDADLVDLVRERQRRGDRVAVLADSPAAAEAFEAADLAIGLSSGRSSRFQARADLLAPGLTAVAALISTGARRDQAAGASVVAAAVANVAGAVWGLQGDPGVLRASYATYAGALAAIGLSWERLRGGGRSRSVIQRLTDPKPERWARMALTEVLDTLDSTPGGLSSEQARARGEQREQRGSRNAFVTAMADQMQSPLVGVLGAGAALSLAMGAVADVAIIGAVIVAGAGVAAWQQREAGRAAQALEQLGAAHARVLRDGRPCEVRADEVVRGDVLMLGPGDRLVADALVLEAEAFEVDESALTGESLPVCKSPDAEQAEARILLDGSDVTVGSAKALVVAVGRGTRLGATAAALSIEQTGESPLGQRLNRLFGQAMPVIVGGGVLVALAGIAWGAPPLSQLTVGASVAIAAVPEGLPLLAGVAEAAVARRLAPRNALVRRLSAVEALGRVEVVCTDKTGTLTQGRLAVTVIDDFAGRSEPGPDIEGSLREVLLTAAFASPELGSDDAHAHLTDAAVLQAARACGLEAALRRDRRDEAPFDPARALHVTALGDRVCVKGAAEALITRCTRVREPGGRARRLAGDGIVRQELIGRAHELAARGLRVLMVAEGPADQQVEDPQELTALGLIGISDPVREDAAEAVARCHAAGIRVVMLTGDHPATAQAIAAQVGLRNGPESMLTGEELGELDDAELSARLERVRVIARITPVDKLRIVESLQRAGHTVAMTGDGVNDAPALRLADVGVAMGAGGTEVARQAADLVLADDRFGTLTDALLEGRSLWHNLHAALGLLLGGNLGEMGLIAGATMLGRGAVLGTRQILAVNLLTDVLPAVAVAVQPPRQQELRLVERRGDEAFDSELIRAVLARGAATAVPALAAVLAAGALGAPASTVAFGSIIVTQLAQTLQMGHAQGTLSASVGGAIAGSCGLVAGAVGIPPVRRFLGLAAPTPVTLALVAATGPAAVVLASRLPG